MNRILLVSIGAIVVLVLIFSFFAAPSPETLLKSARREFDVGHFAQAKPGFLKTIKMSKLSSGPRCEAQIFYATCFVRENDYQAGIRELTTFITQYPNSFWTPQAYFDLAYCYRGVNNLAAAQKKYHYIIKNFPTTSWAQYSRERLKELGEK